MAIAQARERRRHTHGPLLLLAIAFVLLAGLLPTFACERAAAPDSGIEGLVTIGPVSPVSTPGSVNAKPYSAKLQIRRLPGDDLAAEVTSDQQGLFRVALKPGSYVVESQPGNPLPFAAPQEVAVPAGRFIHIEIHFDSGIR